MCFRSVFLAVVACHTAWAAPLKVVTSVPDLAEFARTVGGEHVEVSSLSTGREDPHNVPLRPSMITKLQKADLFIVMGLDFEHAYAPALQQESRNARIQAGALGFLDLSSGVQALDIPPRIDRADGDVHPGGNPHYNLDPVYGLMMVKRITEKLSQLDPQHSSDFKKYSANYSERLSEKISDWQSRLRNRNLHFVSYHPTFSYFSKRFGCVVAGTIQPKPGIEPSLRYIEDLAKTMSANGSNLILKESFYSDRMPSELAKRTGAKLVSVPILVNGTPEAQTYELMIESLVRAFEK